MVLGIKAMLNIIVADNKAALGIIVLYLGCTLGLIVVSSNAYNSQDH